MRQPRATFTGLPDGSHTLAVRAIDLAGNVDPTPASTTFVTAGTPAQDTTPPDTTIAGAIVTGSHARLTFSSNDAGAHFQCQLDGGAFAACTSPVDYNGLPDGTHTFRARAIDGAGNVDPTPATRTFTTLTGGSTPGTSSPGGSSPTPGGGEGSSLGPRGTLDRTAPRVKVVRRTLRASAKGVVTVRVSCPRTEISCRIVVRLERAGHLLARRTVTVAGGQQRERLPAIEQERARKPDASSHVDDRGHTTARDAAGNQATTRTPIRLLAPRRR